MEFYVFQSLIWCIYFSSFNSQWDGILLNKGDLLILSGMFQFPMRWKSTWKEWLQVGGLGGFQFPMGWNSTLLTQEFTPRIGKFQFPMGWNSTLVPCPTRSLSRVSIPNGMEFYTIRINNFWPPLSRFNSQWDGILLYYHRVFLGHPNSFNSQWDGILPWWSVWWYQRSLFQFPMGWNSTNL